MYINNISQNILTLEELGFVYSDCDITESGNLNSQEYRKIITEEIKIYVSVYPNSSFPISIFLYYSSPNCCNKTGRLLFELGYDDCKYLETLIESISSNVKTLELFFSYHTINAPDSYQDVSYYGVFRRDKFMPFTLSFIENERYTINREGDDFVRIPYFNPLSITIKDDDIEIFSKKNIDKILL